MSTSKNHSFDSVAVVAHCACGNLTVLRAAKNPDGVISRTVNGSVRFIMGRPQHCGFSFQGRTIVWTDRATGETFTDLPVEHAARVNTVVLYTPEGSEHTWQWHARKGRFIKAA